MGRSIIVKGADFSSVALASENLFDASQARRNYAVYAPSDTGSATVKTYNGFCVSNYIEIPEGAKKVKIYNVVASGGVRFRFSKTTSDSEEVPQNTGLAGIMAGSSFESRTINVPSDTTYKYFIATIFRGANSTAAANANLTNIRIEVLY